jgi:hypothetical protein
MARGDRISVGTVLIVQLLFCTAFIAAWNALPAFEHRRIVAQIQRSRPGVDVVFTNLAPTHVSPLYDDSKVATDNQLRAVLSKVLPRFSRERLKPNFVEHAVRVWGSRVEFTDPDLISGPQLTDYLLNSGQYVASWGTGSSPIRETADNGVRVRWGKDSSTSVHHDHLLASLAEAGVRLDRSVFTAARQTTMRAVLAESLRDFRLDERETEWSTLAFALYLAPQHTSTWHNAQGRRIEFDMLADRLMRCHRNQGVCLGTHRVYTLMTLLRLNDEYGGDLLRDDTITAAKQFLQDTRDLLVASQSEDGSWPPNWYSGGTAGNNRDPSEKPHDRVIATGHHLEWLAIAPVELQPPHECIVRAAAWLITNIQKTPQDTIDAQYTFYSHAANALAMWRHTTAAEFWSDLPTLP